MNFQDELDKAVDNIRANHNKIIDDWCKAYLAQRYREGKNIDVGSFTLCQQNLSWAQNEVGFKYWFEDGKPNYNGSDAWIKCSDRLPEKNKENVLCFEESYGMFVAEYSRNPAQYAPGYFDRWESGHDCGTEPPDPTHWMQLPIAPKD